jgi:dTDP-4-amino-4,6-dideoxygalactose transaminase
MSTYKGKSLGSIGHMGTFSFHETKNIISGEGGALLINDQKLIKRAEIIREKGTNRSQFFRGQVDKYTWVDIGSSYLPGEIIAAFLWAQMEEAEQITQQRLDIWQQYHKILAPLEEIGKVRQPITPNSCTHNAHMYYILLDSLNIRSELISYLKTERISTVFHYIPLHNSQAGYQYGRTHGILNITENISNQLLRLPLWIGVEDHVEYIAKKINHFFE